MQHVWGDERCIQGFGRETWRKGTTSIIQKKFKWSRYRPDVTQRVGRVIAVLFHDRGTRRGWVVSSTHRPHFTPGKDAVPILKEAGWAPGLVWTGGKSRPHRDSIPDRPARSQSLYRLSYQAHLKNIRYLFNDCMSATGVTWTWMRKRDINYGLGIQELLAGTTEKTHEYMCHLT